MDNNNTIPYGAVTWQNDGIARERHQRTERQAITQRPPALTNSGATFSFARPSSQNTHNGILTGAFNGLRNSSRTTNQQSSLNNFATLQQLATGYSSVATVVHNSPPMSETVEYNRFNSRSPNLFSRINTSAGFRSDGSVDSPYIGQSRLSTERTGTAQAGATRPKRKITHRGNDATGPSSKQRLTERMAAKMYNLRISNDVCSHSCPLKPDHLDSESQKGGAVSTDSSHSFSSMEEGQEEEKDKDLRNDIPTFVLASGVKEALQKNDSILPDAVIRQVNRPCLAVIPWQPVSSLPLVDINIISDKEESITKDHQKSYSKGSYVDDQIIIVDQDLPLVNTKGALPCDYDSFSLDDDDDMDL